MAIVTCKKLKGKETDWYPTFKVEVVFAPGESLGEIESKPHLGWLSDVKILKNGTKKYSKKFQSRSGNDVAYFVSKEKELLTVLGVK